MDAGTVASGMYTSGSKVSDLRSAALLGHGTSQLMGGSRSTPLFDKLASGLSSGTPRVAQALGASPSTAGAGGAAPAALDAGGRTSPAAPAAPGGAGTAVKGGVALAHLGMGGRGGTPRLGTGMGPEQASSLAFLSQDASSPSALQHSSTVLLGGSASASPLGPALAGPASSSLGPAPPAAVPPAASSLGSHPQLPPAVEMPLSWVPPLALARERLDARCPRGHKVVQYRQARRELFAEFGECGRWDGMVRGLLPRGGARMGACRCSCGVQVWAAARFAASPGHRVMCWHSR